MSGASFEFGFRHQQLISLMYAIIIAGVVGSWYNYFSKGPMPGKISNSTVDSLKNFFNMPEEVFSGKGEFTDEHRAAIDSKIKEKFGNVPKAKR